jgi:transposase
MVERDNHLVVVGMVGGGHGACTHKLVWGCLLPFSQYIKMKTLQKNCKKAVRVDAHVNFLIPCAHALFFLLAVWICYACEWWLSPRVLPLESAARGLCTMAEIKISAAVLERLGDRAAVMKLTKAGWQGGRIIAELGLKRDFVYRWMARAHDGGSLLDDPRSGRPKKLEKKQEKKIVKMMEGRASRGVRQVAAILQSTGVDISKNTVHRVALANNLQPVGRVAKPLLKRGVKWHRRMFCAEFRDCEWDKVAFADEATFQCFAMKNRRHDVIWYRIGTERPPTPTVAHGAKVHVYGVFSASGILVLHLFTENFTAEVYMDILENHVSPATRDLDYHWVYLADKSPIHTAKVAQRWLKANVPEVVTPKQWPGYAPDLNPIENAWALMKTRVAGLQPTNLEQLKKAVRRSWEEVMTPEYRQTLAASMRTRITRCWANDGGSTKY